MITGLLENKFYVSTQNIEAAGQFSRTMWCTAIERHTRIGQK